MRILESPKVPYPRYVTTENHQRLVRQIIHAQPGICMTAVQPSYINEFDAWIIEKYMVTKHHIQLPSGLCQSLPLRWSCPLGKAPSLIGTAKRDIVIEAIWNNQRCLWCATLQYYKGKIVRGG